MSLPFGPPFPPMEARQVRELPAGEAWAYEPKWDGFRCLAFRDHDQVELQSKSGKPLGRYFPELVDAIRRVPADLFVVDGEIVVPVGGQLSFEHLLLRVHPTESRVRRLAAENPALFIAFDLLVSPDGQPLLQDPLSARRAGLEALARLLSPRDSAAPIHASPQTLDLATARDWLDGLHGGVDGVIAKRTDLPYDSGGRAAMRKVKRMRSADCVVGGFRYASRDRLVGSLLLGLHDQDGRLHHVGFTSGLRTADRPDLTRRLEAIARPPGFTGRAPGGSSRWATDRSGDWVPLDPILVVEIEYDHFSEGRFRHGTRILRWRPDKAPALCTLDQVARHRRPSLDLL